MNYHRIYMEFIYSRIDREPPSEGEWHHIVPVSLGGDNSAENYIKLTMKEHAFAHHILYEMFSRKGPMLTAFSYIFFRSGYRLTLKVVERLRSNFAARVSEIQRGLVESGEHRFCNSDYQRSVSKFTDGDWNRENQRKRVEAGTHHFQDFEFHSKNAKKQVAEGRHPSQIVLECPHCGKVGAGIRPTHFEYCKKNPDRKERKLPPPQEVVECPHCNKTGTISIMKRWHFDRCKHKVEDK